MRTCAISTTIYCDMYLTCPLPSGTNSSSGKEIISMVISCRIIFVKSSVEMSTGTWDSSKFFMRSFFCLQDSIRHRIISCAGILFSYSTTEYLLHFSVFTNSIVSSSVTFPILICSLSHTISFQFIFFSSMALNSSSLNTHHVLVIWPILFKSQFHWI